MQTKKSSIPDGWLRVIGIALVSVFLLLGDNTFQKPLTVRALALMVVEVGGVAFVWHLNRSLIAYFRFNEALRGKPVRRWLIALPTCIFATAAATMLVDAVRFFLQHNNLTNFLAGELGMQFRFGPNTLIINPYGFDLLRAFFVASFLLIVYELLFYSHESLRYREELVVSEQEREKLRVENLQSQLNVLKQQVNPHFLFNALNSLSALISEDPRQAEKFVDKLSEVYRYVLRANEQQLTTVSGELEFIRAYFHLLQTRYEAGLSLTEAVDESYLDWRLPPLTLQLLVENAVKHNIVSAKRPLHVIIRTDENGWLVVQNTLQRKVSRELSNGVGLTNIVAKYQMLKMPQPTVEEAEGYYTVRLPLLVAQKLKAARG